ncbi:MULTISPECIES: LacI family DNA-binding transcriptional regulator [Arthrobacter]|uniref:LacI family transcriptional regulator n=1 Tax=Arthrobacter jinronghuae TaxID=2964609 RepID=A0ABT1NNL0_9MICC|nr:MULTISPECIES: LacI family DNA-binding transcriptional regulator [Arthrobacter]MCQ1949309.1 LacI family transcriptional regulator [Arthrobacter jinronghuae]MCQ1952630.1 LacI family transcriptional regulator [Arthrobacter sp. zg-Y238]MCQ1955247.1 LacI family transcriptional regulator [Arthrobacter jinronghuae]UWX77910.1 LacI family transcriptional regulator [Arthrobacter jinronghuae]
MAGAVTVRDVARLASVSASTVSRALSASELVAPHTRDRILAAARQLGYSANTSARSLITGRTSNFGLVVPDLENPYFASVTKGVQSRALSEGFAVFVADSDEDVRTEIELARKLASQVDGLILCSPRMGNRDLAAVTESTTVVLVNRQLPQVHSITVDDTEIVRQALGHLYALGHRTVAYAGGPATSWSDGQRRNGIRSALSDLPGLKVAEIGSFRPVFGGGMSAADLAVATGATAVLAYNDLMALGILSRLQARGINVPADMSVVGIDDVSAATLVSPALTTVRAPLQKVGTAAVDALIDSIFPDRPPLPPETLPVELIVRASTSVPSRPPLTSREEAGLDERSSNAHQ